jgi:hypothetical protein
MADASELRIQVRNRAAEMVRVAGRETRDGLREITPRSLNAGVHTADRWTVDFYASDVVFGARLENLSPVIDWLDQGTPPHEIRPVRAKALRFPTRGGVTVFARVVHHPGTKALDIVKKFLTPAAWAVVLHHAAAQVP